MADYTIVPVSDVPDSAVEVPTAISTPLLFAGDGSILSVARVQVSQRTRLDERLPMPWVRCPLAPEYERHVAERETGRLS
jgi:hypothetical protein